jgi:hypothetical protein
VRHEGVAAAVGAAALAMFVAAWYALPLVARGGAGSGARLIARRTGRGRSRQPDLAIRALERRSSLSSLFP